MNHPEGFGPIHLGDLERLRADLEQHDVDVAQAEQRRRAQATPLLDAYRAAAFSMSRPFRSPLDPWPSWPFAPGGGS